MSIEKEKRLHRNTVEKLLDPKGSIHHPSVLKNWSIMVNVSQLHPPLLRSIWLLARYQAFTPSAVSYRDASSIVYNVVKIKQGVVRYPPNIRQTLGRMHQEKVEAFLSEYSPYGEDVRVLVQEVPVEVLLYGDPIGFHLVEPLAGCVLRVPKDVWESLTLASNNKNYSYNLPLPFPYIFYDGVYAPTIQRELPF